MIFRYLKHPAISGAVALGVAVVVGLLLVSGSSAQRTRPVSHVPNSTLVKHFAILRRMSAHAASASSASALPTQVVTGLSDPSEAQLGLDIGAAQQAQPAAGYTAWLVPGSGGVCVVAEQQGADRYGSACYPLRSAADNPVSLQMGTELVGFVPDGNSAVTLSPSSSSSVGTAAATAALPAAQASVSSNAYAFALPSTVSSSGTPAQLQYSNASGAQTQALTLVGRPAGMQAQARAMARRWRAAHARTRH